MNFARPTSSDLPPPSTGAAPAADQRISTLTGDRLCASCTYNLVGQPVIREAHYNMLIVRCPECGTAASVQEYPLLGKWPARFAAIFAAIWFLFLIVLLCGGCAALLGMTGGFTAGIHTWGYNEWLEQQRVVEYNAANPAAPVAMHWELPATFDMWWAQQDAALLFERAGGWREQIEWLALVVYLVPMALAFVLGCMWSVILIHWRRSRLPLASLTFAGVFVVVLVIVWTASYAENINYGWDVAWRQIGLPLYTAAMFVTWIALNIGLQLGRPIVRGMIRAFLPPRLRAPFSLLWTLEGKPVPR